MFTPAAGVLTTTIPTAEDGYTYILLGLMSTTVNAVLAPEHPMFRYYNGGFKTISQISYEAFVAAAEAQDAIDNLEVGGRNYILDSDSESAASTAVIARYVLSEPMVSGDKYTISMTLTPSGEHSAVTVRASDGDRTLATISLSGTNRQTVEATFTAEYASGKTPEDDPDYGDILIYRSPASDGTAATTIHLIKLERGNRATDWTAAPEDAEENLELKLAAVHAQISNTGDTIRQEVQANYAPASDLSNIREQVSTLAEQTEDNYTWSISRINELQSDLTAATEATDEQLNLIRTYMTFGEDGLTIGKTGNPFTFRVVNDRLAFYMNNTEVAYLSNNKLYVTQAEILTKLIIGKFAFEPQTNGNLSLIYTG